MSRKYTTRSEEHQRRITEAIRKHYASPAGQETRTKLSLAAKSRIFSKETRERMSEAQIERFKTQPHPKPNLGKTFTKEIVEKGRQSRLKFYETNEVWNKNKKHSLATRRAISKGMKEYWSIPENRAKMSKAHVDWWKRSRKKK